MVGASPTLHSALRQEPFQLQAIDHLLHLGVGDDEPGLLGLGGQGSQLCTHRTEQVRADAGRGVQGDHQAREPLGPAAGHHQVVLDEAAVGAVQRVVVSGQGRADVAMEQATPGHPRAPAAPQLAEDLAGDVPRLGRALRVLHRCSDTLADLLALLGREGAGEMDAQPPTVIHGLGA